jgi:hypothetical protein
MEMTNATSGGGGAGPSTTTNDGSSSFGQPAKRTTRKGGGDMAMALNYVFLPDDHMVLKGMYGTSMPIPLRCNSALIINHVLSLLHPQQQSKTPVTTTMTTAGRYCPTNKTTNKSNGC